MYNITINDTVNFTQANIYNNIQYKTFSLWETYFIRNSIQFLFILMFITFLISFRRQNKQFLDIIIFNLISISAMLLLTNFILINNYKFALVFILVIMILFIYENGNYFKNKLELLNLEKIKI